MAECVGVRRGCGSRRRAETAEELAAGAARQVEFLQTVLPALRNVARKWARRLWSAHDREDFVGDVVAWGFRRWVRQIAGGHDPAKAPGHFAAQTCAAVCRGVGLGGTDRGKCALSRRAQRAGGFTARRCGEEWQFGEARDGGAAVELREWLGRLPGQERRLLERLAEGRTRREVADELGVARWWVDKTVKKLRAAWERRGG